MYLSYGSYTHPAGEVTVAIQRTPTFNEGGQLYGYKETWHIQGFLQAVDQRSLTTALNSLKAAYSQQAGDLVLHLDDGTFTTHALLAVNCIGGTRVVGGPSFPDGKGAEYSTYRNYEITVEGDVPNVDANLMAFMEVVTFEGDGGPLTVILQTLTGQPQKQTTAQQTPFRATQQGSAIGHFAYPPIPLPIWPDALIHPRVKPTKKLPKRSGPIGRPTYTEWEVSWSYEFESVTPLVGDPTAWPN